VLGLAILLLGAIGCGIAGLSILGHPGWLWQILASIAVLNAFAAVVVVLRRERGRRLAHILLAAETVWIASILVVAATVMIGDNPTNVDGSLRLTFFLFVPAAIAVTATTLLAAWSINRLEWPDR